MYMRYTIVDTTAVQKYLHLQTDLPIKFLDKDATAERFLSIT